MGSIGYVNRGMRFIHLGLSFLATLGLVGCASEDEKKSSHPPLTEYAQTSSSAMQITSVTFDENSIIPDINAQPQVALNDEGTAVKTCSFSSFQRNNTIGYEIDPSRHVSFNASPSFDIWNPTDFEAKVSLKFTKALGGPANKRPCTFGSGYYGLVPYLTNNPETLSVITDPTTIKSLVQEKARERKERQKEQEERQKMGL